MARSNIAQLQTRLTNVTKSDASLPAVELIRCSGDDRWLRRRQWNDSSNTLCIAPGTVVTYEKTMLQMNS